MMRPSTKIRRPYAFGVRSEPVVACPSFKDELAGFGLASAFDAGSTIVLLEEATGAGADAMTLGSAVDGGAAVVAGAMGPGVVAAVAVSRAFAEAVVVELAVEAGDVGDATAASRVPTK